MISRKIIRFAFGILIVFSMFTSTGFSQTAGLDTLFPQIKILESNNPAPGYFFLASKGLRADNASQYLAIVDNFGLPVFFRKMKKASGNMRLLPDGRIAYLTGVPRVMYFMNEMLKVTDTLTTKGYKIDGHDWAYDSNNGHTVLMGRAKHTEDMSLVVEGGDTAATIKDAIIQEFDADKNLLYTWNSADHFEVTDANENSPYIDFTKDEIDPVHINSVAIDSDTSILISSRHMDEITKIDRRTGDIIWRLGGKKNDFTFINDTIGFSHQHSVSRLKNGHVLLFDNGNLNDSLFSSTVEYDLDEVNMTATLVHRFRRDPDTYSNHGACTQREEHGNTIIGWGVYWPSFTEFHPDGSMALDMDFTEHSFSPRIEKFMWKTKVFETSVDSIDFGMWDGSSPSEQLISLHNNSDEPISISSFSTRTGFFEVVDTLPREIPPNGDLELTLSFNPEEASYGYMKDVMTLSYDTETQRIARQVVLFGQREDNVSPVVSILPDSALVPASTLINISFSEPVRRADGTELTYNNVNDLILLRKDEINGEDVPFKAIVNTEKNYIYLKLQDSLESGQKYYVIIENDKFEDYSGNPVLAKEQEFFTYPSTGIRDNFYTRLKVYPNPGNGLFNIDSAYEGEKSLEVYNLLGGMVLQMRNIAGTSFLLDLTGQVNGIYLVIIRSSNKNKVLETGRIVIQD